MNDEKKPLSPTTQQVKEYIERLNSGEDLEVVRRDFVRDFANVDTAVIMEAEQELLDEGMELSRMQKLCDVHAALFQASIEEDGLAAYLKTPGHPLYTLTKENEAIAALVSDTYGLIEQGCLDEIDMDGLCQVSIHYAKKGDNIYPLLKRKYNVAGPSDVMWTLDDDIRDSLKALRRKSRDDSWAEDLRFELGRMEDMITKETKILFDICWKNFSEADWVNVYYDFKDYKSCLVANPAIWLKAEMRDRFGDEVFNVVETEDEKLSDSAKVKFKTGSLTVEQLDALLNLLPVEISIVDVDDNNAYFNQGHKLFKRPLSALGHSVYECHPPMVKAAVKAILQSFKDGEKDRVVRQGTKEGHSVKVEYIAMRDEEGKYIGTCELVWFSEE